MLCTAHHKIASTVCQSVSDGTQIRVNYLCSASDETVWNGTTFVPASIDWKPERCIASAHENRFDLVHSDASKLHGSFTSRIWRKFKIQYDIRCLRKYQRLCTGLRNVCCITDDLDI